MFHENHIRLYDCEHPDYLNIDTNNIEKKIINGNLSNIENSYSVNTINCQIKDRLDGNCLCQNYNNYFTIGVEEMYFNFDYKYLTSFKKGGNMDDKNKGSIITKLYDTNGDLYKEFNKNQNIRLTMDEWMKISNVELDKNNFATKLSEGADDTKIDNAKFRTSGIEILLKIDCSNFKTFTNMNYGDTLCKIYPYINEGWASKGSMINYIKYPELDTEYINSIYYDRYRYGIKFKFLFTGTIGEFNVNNFINTLLSGVVLFGTSATIILLVLTNFFHGYMKNINNISLTSFKQKNYNTCKKFCKGICFCKKKNNIESDDIQSDDIQSDDIQSDDIQSDDIQSDNLDEIQKENIRIAIV